MSYQVKINGDGTHTVFENGNPLAGAKVRRFSFPGNTSHTLEGEVHHISGPGTADIELADGTIINDVPFA